MKIIAFLFSIGYVVFLGIATIGCVYYIWKFIQYAREKPKPVEPIVPVRHRDLQKELDDILLQAEKEKVPLITLWWGLDGLQLNRDGTTEWISKKPKEKKINHSYDWLKPAPIPTYPLDCTKFYQPILYGFNCQACSPEELAMYRTLSLKDQLNTLNQQQTQHILLQSILDRLGGDPFSREVTTLYADGKKVVEVIDYRTFTSKFVEVTDSNTREILEHMQDSRKKPTL